MATRLRDRMIAEMEVRGLKEATRKQYLYDVEKFFEFYKDKPPKEIGVKDIKAYQLYLIKERQLAPNSINKQLSPIRFYYRYVLGRHWYADSLPRVKTPRTMPVVLAEEEVAAIHELAELSCSLRTRRRQKKRGRRETLTAFWPAPSTRPLVDGPVCSCRPPRPTTTEWVSALPKVLRFF